MAKAKTVAKATPVAKEVKATSAKGERKERKGRAVSYNVTTVKGKRVFTPVNKRAKMFHVTFGGKTEISNLKGLKAVGFRLCEYKGDKLVALKV